MTTTARRETLDRLIRENTVTVPNMGDVLWVNKLYYYKPTLLEVYGPTLYDVCKNLGVYCAYERNTPKIYDTKTLISEAFDNLPEIQRALETQARGTEERFFEIYRAMFGLKRVTLSQVTEVVEALRAEGVMVPTRMAWYFRFQGFSNFYPAYLKYLGAHPKGMNPETGELLEKHPDRPDNVQEEIKVEEEDSNVSSDYEY